MLVLELSRPHRSRNQQQDCSERTGIAAATERYYGCYSERIGSSGSCPAGFWPLTGGLAAIIKFTDKVDQRNQELAQGAILTREWNGRDHRVMVLADGFAFEGKTYDSLSKVAFAITGTKWNGPRFFGLRAATASPQ